MSFVVVTGESHFFGREFLPMLRGGFVTIVWAAVASALLAAGIVRRVKVARLMGLGILALSVAKLMLVDTSSLATPGRVGVFAAVGALLIAGAFLYLKFRNRFEEAGAEARPYAEYVSYMSVGEGVPALPPLPSFRTPREGGPYSAIGMNLDVGRGLASAVLRAIRPPLR
jgi:hypothetical protein